MKMSLNAVLLISEEFLNESPNRFFIMTKSLNQDKLENTFAVLRQKGGNSNNPTVSDLNNLFANIISRKIIQSSFVTNCENEDIDEVECSITEFCTSDIITQNETENNDSCNSLLVNVDQEIYSDEFLEDVFENCSTINIELLSLRYFIGYIAFKSLHKIDCEHCIQQLRKEDEVLTCPSELYIFFKNHTTSTDFGNMVAPSNEFMDVSKKHVIVFYNIFTSQPHIIGIRNLIVENCKKITPEWFIGDCANHREEILIFMTTILLRKHSSWTVKGEPQGTKRKLNILKNT